MGHVPAVERLVRLPEEFVLHALTDAEQLVGLSGAGVSPGLERVVGQKQEQVGMKLWGVGRLKLVLAMAPDVGLLDALQALFERQRSFLSGRGQKVGVLIGLEALRRIGPRGREGVKQEAEVNDVAVANGFGDGFGRQLRIDCLDFRGVSCFSWHVLSAPRDDLAHDTRAFVPVHLQRGDIREGQAFENLFV